jgi:arginase
MNDTLSASSGFQRDGSKVAVLGVPFGHGAGQKGSELGVEALRLARLGDAGLLEHIGRLGYTVEDLGDVDVVRPGSHADSGSGLKYLSEVAETARRSAAVVKDILSSGAMPVILGGDHSVAIGTFSGIASHFKRVGEEIGLLWFDAHADFNTPESSPSGNIHGMPLAVLMGEGDEALVGLEGFSPKIDPSCFAHVGARDLDPAERSRIREKGLSDRFFTMSDIDRIGMVGCMERALDIVSKAPAGFAVTFDVDIIDPRFAPGSGTLVRGGITYREAHLALEMVADRGGMRSFEIVEVNPMLDNNNITVELAGELILSVLGKRIL